LLPIIVSAVVGVVVTSSWAGSIFLTGHDPDFHALLGGNSTGARNINKVAIAFIRDSQFNPFFAANIKKFLFVESKATPPSGHTNGVNGIVASGFVLGTDFEHHSALTLGAELDQLGTKYSAIVVASDFGGVLRQAELDILNARASDIVSFLDAGGGLYAMAESNAGAQLTPNGGHFRFLPFVVPSTIFQQSETGIMLTPFGLSLGLANTDVNGNVSHNIFLGSSGLEIVDVDRFGNILSLAGRKIIGLDHFLCYKTKSTKGDICTADAPANAGGVCEIEEDCGGNSLDDELDETSFCVPNKFPKGLRVSLFDQREPTTRIFDVKKPVNLCAPADKSGEGIINADTHLQGYQIVLTKSRCAAGAPANAGGGCTKETDCGGDRNTSFCVLQPRSVKQLNLSVTNQFHSPTPLIIEALKPNRLLVPTAKNLADPPGPPAPRDVDHYKCYQAKVSKGTPKFAPILGVVIDDQFSPAVPRVFDLKKPMRVCVAADKNGEGIKHSSAHLMCYKAVPSKKVCAAAAASNANGACTREADCGGVKGSTRFCVAQPKFQKVSGIFVDNQFVPSEVDTTKEDEFCVPSTLAESPA